MKTLLVLSLISAVGILLVPQFVWGQGSNSPPFPDSVKKFFNNLTVLLFRVALALSVIFLIILGMKYITSGGEGVQRSHSGLLWLIVGVILVLIALSAPALIKGLIQDYR